MKKLLSGLVVGLAILVLCLPAKAAEPQELGELMLFTLEHGIVPQEGNYIFIGKIEKPDEKTERHLYFTMRIALVEQKIVVWRLDFVNEVWSKDGKGIVTAKQLVILDGKPNEMDGQADIYYEQTLIDGRSIGETPAKKVTPEIQKIYDGYVKEMLEAARMLDEQDKEDEPEIDFDLVKPYKVQI